MTLAPGARLGHYHVVDKLGREVALKVLPVEMTADPARIERFQREARALATLDYPGIVTVFSVEESDGVHFLTMQLVEGRPLDRIIAAEDFPLERILAIGTALADALAAAHERGIVHRDLKPANVMIAGDGRVKALDFGPAKVAEPGGEPEATVSYALTQAGAVMGTVPYMSPEQVSGRAVDHRTDIFALGVILYEMATGQRPFAGASSAELVSAILRDAPVALAGLRPDLPPALAGVIEHCLAKDPVARFQSMREVGGALWSLPAADAGPEIPASRGPQARSRRLATAGGVAVLLAAAAYLTARSGVLRPAAGARSVASEPRVIRSLAVLPLDNYSGDPSQDYFAERMTDELTTDLATISQLGVISRGSAMQFAGAHRPATPEIAKALNVDAIVEGSVLPAGDKVWITAQLIDARSDEHLWAKSFERSSRDVLALQAELASAIASEIRVQLTPGERSRLASARKVDPEAYEAYLKGRYFFNRPSDENLRKAIRLDDGSAEAHTSLAAFRLSYEYDWAGCEAEFRRAIALNPSYAFAHDQLGLGLSFQGRLDEAIAEGARAAELDPLSPQVPIDAIFAFTWQGRYDEARAQRPLVGGMAGAGTRCGRARSGSPQAKFPWLRQDRRAKRGVSC